MANIVPISAFNDNYIWLIIHPQLKKALVVDPGEASPVIATLQELDLSLAGILITHHHWDHTDGIAELLDHDKVPVYGPANDSVALCTDKLNHDDRIHIKQLGFDFKIMEIPGHTKGHIAFYGLGSVFTGDTLFTGGCGRLFEGTAKQMLDSLKLLASLPGGTAVYCGHEYTEKNLRFASLVEPNNPSLKQRIDSVEKMRKKCLPTVPSTIEIERNTNPFLRCHIPEIKASVEAEFSMQLSDEIEVFSRLRRWKDNF